MLLGARSAPYACFFLFHLRRMALAMKQDEALDQVDVSLLGADTMLF